MVPSADALQIPEQTAITAGHYMLPVVGNVSDLRNLHRLGATAEPGAAFEQRHLFTGLGQPHRGGKPGQTAPDHDVSPGIVHAALRLTVDPIIDTM